MRQTQTFSWPTPVRGWYSASGQTAAPLDSALRLDNFFPTAQSSLLRGGCRLHATLPDCGRRFMTYTQGDVEQFFVSTDAAIYEIAAPSSPDVTPAPVKSGLSSGDWVSVQFGNAGNYFMVGVNGADAGFSYDGVSFSDLNINNVSSDVLTQCWLYANRVWFVEKNTMSAWYLPVEAVGGDAEEINLQSIFSKGGNLLFGASWSLDTGDGLDDKCVFVTDQGEVAVYAGSNPNSADTWSLQGVYQLGKPIDKHASFRVGGHLMMVTEDGIYPLQQAISVDYATLLAGAMTDPIKDKWLRDAALSSGIKPVSATHWRSRGYLMVSVPAEFESQPVAFICNTRTNAWARYLGWDVYASEVFSDSIYFSDTIGRVFQAETGGNDNGVEYSAYYTPQFTDFGIPNVKIGNHCGLVARSAVDVKWRATLGRNFAAKDVPAAEPLPEPVGLAVWGVSKWGAADWGGAVTLNGVQKWKAVANQGFALAPTISFTANSTVLPALELTAVIVRYEIGSAL